MPELEPSDRNERFIEYAVKEFETSVRMMIRDKSCVHLFDFNGTKDGVTELWSFMIVAGPKREMAVLEKTLGAAKSHALKEEGGAGEKP